jgi:excisionase family DNA binding protein
MDLLNTTEAAESLGVSVRRVRQLIDEGKLTAQKVGRDYAIQKEALSMVEVYGKAGRPPKAKESNGKKSVRVKK